MLDLIIEFAFVRRTMAVGLMLSVAIPLIGIVMVNRRTSMMGMRYRTPHWQAWHWGSSLDSIR